jgi:hypothetical protein
MAEILTNCRFLMHTAKCLLYNDSVLTRQEIPVFHESLGLIALFKRTYHW